MMAASATAAGNFLLADHCKHSCFICIATSFLLACCVI